MASAGATCKQHVNLQGGALILAVCREGTTEVNGIEHIDRGYVAMEEKLAAVGARIKRVAAAEEVII